MTPPSILNIDRETTIPQEVFSDLQVRTILPPIAVSVLSHPCSADMIKKRQELFLLLDDEAYLTSFRGFYDSIRALMRRDFLYRKASVPVAKTFALAELLHQYIAVCRSIAPLCGCELTDALVGYWCDTEHETALTMLESALSDADEHLRRISQFDVSFHIKSWVTPDRGEPSYIDSICEHAEGLGFNVDVKSAHVSIAEKGWELDSSLGDAVGKLFESELSPAAELLNAHIPPELSALEKYYDEAMFYLEIHDFLVRARSKNIPICIPRISSQRQYAARSAYDVTLLSKDIHRIVPNDIDFHDKSSFYFLVGANGGGKTTYLRCIGVNLLLFLGGAPIFADDAEIYPFRGIRTHFPADERMAETGRLDDELRRVTEILDCAGDESFLLFNETYSGTNDEYGSALAIKTASEMTDRGLFGIFVTHFHELENRSFDFLEVVVDEKNENERTYKIMPKKTNTGSHAADILKKYGLDSDSLERRSRNNATTSARS